MANCPEGLSPGFGISAPASNAICFIKSYFGIGPDGLGVYKSGSGMLFGSGAQPRHVVTAAHNIYDHTTRRNAIWASMYFGRVGNISVATRDATAMFTPDAFRAADEAPPNSDFGVMRINPLGTDRFRGIPLALSTATGETRKLLIGYPDDGICKGECRPYNATLTVGSLGASNYRYVDQSTYIGMSGGPLLSNGSDGSELRSFGLHIRGEENAERAIRFSQPVYDQIMAWI